MTLPPRRLAALLPMLLLASVLSYAGPSATARTADPHAGEPANGACFALAPSDLAAENLPTDSAVDCATQHTAMVIHRIQVDGKLGDPDNVYPQLERGCWKKLASTLGSTAANRAQSIFGWVFYVPTKAERRAGARWATCLVVQPKGRKLRELASTSPLIHSTLTSSQKRCADVRYRAIACSAKHQWRSVTPFKIKGGHPSEKRALAIARDRCPKAGTGRTFLYRYPSKAAFQAGWKMMVCFRKSTT